MIKEMAKSANLRESALAEWIAANGTTASQVIQNLTAAKFDFAPKWDALHLAVIGNQDNTNPCFVAMTAGPQP